MGQGEDARNAVQTEALDNQQIMHLGGIPVCAAEQGVFPRSSA